MIVEPDEVEGCPDPRDAGDDVDGPAQQVEPIHRIACGQDLRAAVVVRPAFSATSLDACVSRSCSSCAATATAMAAASLLRIPPIPIGIARREISREEKPR